MRRVDGIRSRAVVPQVREGAVTTAIALLRVSTPDQKLGLEAQRADITRFAAAHDIEVTGWHTEFISGGAPFELRAGLQAACEDVAKVGAKFLLVAKRDRFARDPLVAMLTERTLASMSKRLPGVRICKRMPLRPS